MNPSDIEDSEERARYERYLAAKARVDELSDDRCRDWLRSIVGAIWCDLDDSSEISPRKHIAGVFDKHILRGNVMLDGFDVAERGHEAALKAQGAAEEREQLTRDVAERCLSRIQSISLGLSSTVTLDRHFWSGKQEAFAEVRRWLLPRFKVGDRVVLVCRDKAECGGTGVVSAIRSYSGPRMVTLWEYDLDDGKWNDGRPHRWCGIRETWLALQAGDGASAP